MKTPLSILLKCCIALSLLSGCKDEDKTKSRKDEISKQTLEVLLPEVLERVRTEYIDAVPESRLVEGALGGVLMALDPYSHYLEPRDAAELKNTNSGEFEGIGLEILPVKTGLKVISAIDDTPAYHAAIQAGDLITHINSQDVTKILISDALKQLCGKPGTELSLTLLEQSGKKRNVTLSRSKIVVNPVKAFVREKIAYLRISLFNKNCEK
jgi:carboxyl-terminal processing protease